MATDISMSVLMIGYRRDILDGMADWFDRGILCLAGVIDPLVDQIPEEVPLVHYAEQVNHQEIHFILITGNEAPYHQELKNWDRKDRVVITPDSIWILEKLARTASKIQSLTEKQQFYQTILMHSHEGVQFVDSEGIIQFINPSFSRITNVSPEERLGKHIEEVSPGGSLNKAYKTRAPVFSYKSTSVGSNVETVANAAPIFVEGKFIGAVATFQDVTEVKYLTEKLMEHEQEQRMISQQSSDRYESKYSLDHIIGESNEIKEAINIAKKAARTRSTVLITGESGTGKELFAHAIHTESKCSDKPFVTVNCAAIPADLLESELFGYEKGAFTHAIKQKLGKIELANEGTLFLDEIGEMSVSLQAKLLRVLQHREFERIGGLKKIHVEFRIIAATNADLETLVSEGKFREDLFYRLNVIRLEVPPLRERKQDIPLLVQELLNGISQRIGLSPMQLTDKGTSILSKHDWPGNIRELENVLERLMNESPSSVISDSLVLKQIQRILGPSSETGDYSQSAATSLLPLKDIEKEHIQRTLHHFGNSLESKKQAARSLGISISTLYNKIRDYQLE
ncbi:sigma-54 interaction domain-containing protein [Bacillus norwichensis]|uniref:Sigma 54-interacting transcriptional regulator n=1 Tax=Bacillus norwichensis TaxID=2762217 RepID=A0ABR8VNF3_9BACI|nr:sigma 54-interacting transcriptional regulator [Bacillus norwichensis]MBD8006301.1 sigma 54-interacting transcriptional regulator [Bacillus norwichensis]